MSNGKSVMIVGVGGQGTLLASRLLGAAMTAKGFDVKVSEVHGMSQRGGSVVTYVRYGEKVYSPIIEEGEADIVLAFEQMEAARYLPYLKKGGAVVVNTQKMDPMPVVTGAAVYPEGLLDQIAAKGHQGLGAGCSFAGRTGRFGEGCERGADWRHGQEPWAGAGGLASGD